MCVHCANEWGGGVLFIYFLGTTLHPGFCGKFSDLGMGVHSHAWIHPWTSIFTSPCDLNLLIGLPDFCIQYTIGKLFFHLDVNRLKIALLKVILREIKFDVSFLGQGRLPWLEFVLENLILGFLVPKIIRGLRNFLFSD